MKKLAIGLLMMLVYEGAQSQTPKELNGLIQQSFGYFPRIKELNAASEINEMRIDVAHSNYLPNASGIATYNYVNPIPQKAFGAPGAEELLKFQPYNNYNFNVGVTQMVWDFGRTKAQVEKAKADLLVSKQNTESAKLQLASQVASIYYSMIFLSRAIVVQDSAIAFYINNQKIIEGKIRQGDGLQIDLSTMENNIDQEKNRKVEFQRQYQRQEALMRYTTGQALQPSTAEFEFKSGGLPSDLASNPDLMAAVERVSSAQADARLALSNRLPSLGLQAGAGFRNGYQPNIEPLRFNILAGATLNVPIFQGGRIRKNITISNKTIELAEYSKANLSSTLQKDIESVQADLLAYEEQINNSEGQIKVARETLRLTQVRYKEGVITYLDLINAATNLQRAFLNKLQYEYQQTLARVELCRIYGVKFWQE